MELNQSNDISVNVRECKFAGVVLRMQKISDATDMAEKKAILGNFFHAITQKQKIYREKNGPNADFSFYPFLRFFLPEYDETERGAYGIHTKRLGKLFVKALAINAKSDDGKKLTDLQGNNSDYGDIVYEVMKMRAPKNSTLTVFEVNKHLDLIASNFRKNEQRKTDTEITQMVLKMSALELKWLTRILLEKLDLKLGQQYILKTYHANALDLFNKCSHLSRVCELIESNLSLDEIQKRIIEVSKPVRSMLCERGYMSNINDMLKKHDYYLETKMDGERCQLHMNGTEFKYFSRRSKEDGLTRIFGATSTTGLYSPYLYDQLKGKVRNAIFDGEMMVWDRETDAYLKKAENFTAKHLKHDDNRYRPCYCIYDLIYLNGESLIEKPYAERIRKLKTIVVEQRGALMLCERIKLRDGDHFVELFNKAFDSNEEGVVIKQEDSKYRPGQRERGGWFKMKPDYENNLISDFDLLIIGGYYNDKRTAIDSFLLAVLKKPNNNNDGVFHAVCRIRNGLKRSQFAEILTDLQPYRHEIKNGWKECPSDIEWANANPHFWFDPKYSIVLQIKASELTQTTTYRTSHSFRFPRVMKIRRDKMWSDVCTLNEFQTFCTSNSKVEKLTKRHATSNDLASATILPKRKRGPVSKPSSSVASTSYEVEAIDNVCKDLEFHIIGGDIDLKNMVKRHGGKCVEYPNSKTFVIIAPNPTSINAQKFKSKKQWNIAKKAWLIEALGSDRPLNELKKFTADDMVYATDALQEEFAAEFNEDEDFETPPMNYENLNGSVEQMDIDDHSNSGNNTSEEDEIDIFAHDQLVPNEIIQNQPEACEEGDVPMDEASSNNKTIEPPAIEPVVLIDEPQEMEQNVARVNDSVYDCDTQLIQPVMINEESITVPNKTEDNEINATIESAELNEDANFDPTQMFSSCVGYFYHDESIEKCVDMTMAECALIDGGGECLDTLDDVRESASRLTHIFVDTDNLDHAKLNQMVESFGVKNINDIQFLRYQWITECDTKKKLICDRSYKFKL